MRFILFAAINGIDEPNRATGEQLDQQERFRRIIDEAVLADRLGYDAYAVGERHAATVINSSPPVILSHVAALTARIRFLTTLTVLSVLDPVRVAEDYATLDHLSKGRLEIMVGRGSDPSQYPIFGFTADEARMRFDENRALLARLWSEEGVTWAGQYRPRLDGVTTQPRTYQDRIRIWHGGSSRLEAAASAARAGEALFSTASGPDREPYRAYFDHYRSTWASEGRDPAEAYTGISGGFTYLARTTEEAIAGFEPYYANYLATSVGRQNRSPYRDLRDYVERGPTLVGSPADVAAKILDYHSVYRNDAINLLVDALPLTEQREQLEWFAEEVIPIVRREAPTRLWAQADAARPRSTTA